MIVKFHGETSLNKLPKLVKEIVENVQERSGLEKNRFTLKDVELGILFNVSGEKMMLNSYIGEDSEPFTVHVQLDKKGNIAVRKDNEKESFLDEYSKAVKKGLDTVVDTEIDSVFTDEQLELKDTEELGDLVVKSYVLRDNKEEYVIRYYRNDKLVGETGFKSKKEV